MLLKFKYFERSLLQVIFKAAAAERLVCVFAAVLCVLCLHMLYFTQRKVTDTMKHVCKTASLRDVKEDVCVRAHSEPSCLPVGLCLSNTSSVYSGSSNW